jgi:hypothetical protein
MLGSRRVIALGAGLLALAGVGGAIALAQRDTSPEPGPQIALSGPGLTAFRSEAELRNFLRPIQRRMRRGALGSTEGAMSDSVAAPAPMQAQAGADSESPSEPSITNNQEAGVDEGGIVKSRGDLLVMLRRGRLFTVSTAGGALRAVDSINAFPPGVDGSGDWYDEMLIAGDRVIVIGYSYRRGGTEVNRFRLTADGQLSFEDAYHLRSNDYYSSRNYASRLIGNRLVYYTPLYLGAAADPLDSLPAMRRWDGKADGAFRRIAAPQQIFVAPRLRNDIEKISALHSVVNCDLTAPVLDCSAIGVLGPASRTFYVAQSGVYLWVNEWSSGSGDGGGNAFIYRLPFASERPSAIAASGAPVDQFSFREDAGDRMLNVLVRADGGGDGMWGPEVSQGDVALLRVPIAAFGDGSREAPDNFYRSLPRPQGENWNFHNRFVGNHVLYGGGAFGEASKEGARVFVAPVRNGPVTEIGLAHAVERIEILGSDAVVVGGDGTGALGFSAIDLAGRPRIGNLYIHPAASEGETRSHAYFYRPDPGDRDGASGLLGLPIAKPVEASYRRFFGSAASMLFLRRDNRQFAPAGELDSQVRGVVDDNCVASCVDWYGNARPIFLRNRIFALLGYELVEGTFDGRSIREVRRLNYAPTARLAGRDG